MNELLAAIVLAACAALLLRMVLPDRHRWRLDAAWRDGIARLGRGLRRAVAWLRGRGGRLRRLPRQDTQIDAERLARDAIERARRVDWDGNVGRPTRFRAPPAERQDGQPKA